MVKTEADRKKKRQKREEKDVHNKHKNNDAAATKRSAKKAKHDKKTASSTVTTITATTSTTPRVPVGVVVEEGGRHAFQVNSLDHCESPLVAYQHIDPVLRVLSTYITTTISSSSSSSSSISNKQSNVSKPSGDELRIWDPYYCDGAVKRHLQALGWKNVYHENEDFYAVIKAGCGDGDRVGLLPPHDVLITNPPYSEDHIERLLTFLATHHNPQVVPFLLLLPNWVARKKDYAQLMPNKKNIFYLAPVEPYAYVMPHWNTKDRPEHVGEDGTTTPYLSSWYIHAGDKTEELMNTMNSKRSKEWVVAKTIKGLKWKIQKLQK